MPRVLAVFLGALLASGADFTFVEVSEIVGSNVKQERTTSIFGTRIAIDSDDVTFIFDPSAGTVTEVDRARAEFGTLSSDAFEARLAAARADLSVSLRESGEGVTDVRITFPRPERGPRILNVETQLLRWTLKGQLASMGNTPALSSVLTLTNDCAVGKVDNWRQIRQLQNLEIAPLGLVASSLGELQSVFDTARERLSSLEGAVVRCMTRTRAEFPPTGGVTRPAQEVEMRTEMVSLKPTATPGLFRIPSDYKPVEFPMNSRRMLAYIALPPFGEPAR